tara:strand:+ start:2396 stop:3115 length:720 start_codon:yes stop_codon:yes gene_type:complete
MIKLGHGQFSQDLCTQLLFGVDFKGVFLDLGCGIGHLNIEEVPESFMSNTYALEQMGWKGIAIDYDKAYCDKLQKTRDSVICVDLMKNNINEVLESNNCPTVVDYLSFDVDEAQRKVLDELDFNKYKFKFITYEHNYSHAVYNKESIYAGDREYSRAKFLDLGYKILWGNVGTRNNYYIEDWYICSELYDKYSYLHQDPAHAYNVIKALLALRGPDIKEKMREDARQKQTNNVFDSLGN